MNVICMSCEKEFRTYPSRIKIGWGKYCSKKCQNKSQIGHSGHWLGKKRPELMGTGAIKTMFKRGASPWNKGIEWARMRGENNPRWVGDNIRHEDKRLRRNNKYKEWRKAVYQRDDYTCQFCLERGGKLQADHIKPFSIFPKLRYSVPNGRTLCESCHKKTDTYARGSVYLKQLFTEISI